MLHCIVIEPIHYPGGRRREPGEKVHLPKDVYDRLRSAGCVQTLEEHAILKRAEEEAERFRLEAERAADEAQRAAREEAEEQAAAAREKIEGGTPSAEPRTPEMDLEDLDDMDRDDLLAVVDRHELEDINTRRHEQNLREDVRAMLELRLEAERAAPGDNDS